MPTITVSIKIHGKIIALKIDTSKPLKDYEKQIQSLIASESDLKMMGSHYQFFHENRALDPTKTLEELDLTKDMTLSVKPIQLEITGLAFLKDVAEEDLVRFVIGDEKITWQKKEKQEKNSVKNSLIALAYSLEKSEEPTIDFLKKIHQYCTGSDAKIKGGEFFNTHSVALPFGFPYANLSVKGLEDLIKFAKKYHPFGITPTLENLLIGLDRTKQTKRDLSKIPFNLFYSTFIEKYKLKKTKMELGLSVKSEEEMKVSRMFVYGIEHTKEQCSMVIFDIFKQYKENILKAKKYKDDNALVMACIQCMQDLILLHPFEDFNARSAKILLNYLLTQQGFPPTCYFRTDGQSNEEIFAVIKKGMLKTLDLAKKSKSILKTSEEYDILIKPLIDVIKKHENVLSQNMLESTANRVAALKDYPDPKWIVYFDNEKEEVVEGEVLVIRHKKPVTKDQPFFSESADEREELESKNSKEHEKKKNESTEDQKEGDEEEVEEDEYEKIYQEALTKKRTYDLQGQVIFALDSILTESHVTSEKKLEIRSLIEAGANPNAKSEYHDVTPLEFISSMPISQHIAEQLKSLLLPNPIQSSPVLRESTFSSTSTTTTTSTLSTSSASSQSKEKAQSSSSKNNKKPGKRNCSIM